jgi:hypothetical protein
MVIEHYPAGGGEFVVAFVLADHAYPDGTHIFPSVRTLAKSCRQSERGVQYHLAKMRRLRWLIVDEELKREKNISTTVYRVNPAWLSNPKEFNAQMLAAAGVREPTARGGAIFAPPLAKPRTGVQFSAGRGAIDDRQGCKAIAPKPTRTVIEPTTTAPSVGDAVVVGLDNLEFPEFSRDAALDAARVIVADAKPTDRQMILDEWAAVDASGGIRKSQLGYLRTLVQASRRGPFVATQGVEWRAKLNRARSLRSLRFPDGLGSELDDVKRWITDAPESRRQPLLDELAAIKGGNIVGKRGLWLRDTISREAQRSEKSAVEVHQAPSQGVADRAYPSHFGVQGVADRAYPSHFGVQDSPKGVTVNRELARLGVSVNFWLDSSRSGT